MRLEGSIDAFSLPDIFSLLSMTKKTGGLHLRRAGAHGVVWFTTGAITGGSADVHRHTLARRLLGTGAVDDDSLTAALAQAADGDIGIVRALQQQGAVDDATLHDTASEHVVDVVFDLLRWPEGDFAFVVDELNPDDVGVSRPVDDVVAEARRRLDTWSAMAGTVPAYDAVLSLSTTLSDPPQLDRDEWALVALVDGARRVDDIVTLAGRGEFQVVSALAALVGRGLLQVGGDGGVATLLRRHELLAGFESNGTTQPDSAAAPDEHQPEPEPAPQPLVTDETADDVGDDAGDDVEQEDDIDDVSDGDNDDTEAPTESTLAARLRERRPHSDADGAPVRPLRAPAQRDEVTPQRPEPFLPPRQPDHPDEPVPVAAVAGMGAAAAPAAASAALIERDPSVNKSLLLRLIAGVRGL